MASFDYDVVIIGSGFGGSVAALRVAVARVDGRLYAFDDLCPCTGQACPLSGGPLAGATIMCQCHGSRFDVVTGSVIDGPAEKPLNIHEVQEVDGGIRIRLD